MAHNHQHEVPESGKRLALVAGLNIIITITEVVGGILSGSLSLISDALHNFSDGVAIVIAWVAIKLNGRPRTGRHTFGMKRAEILAAVINAGSLVAISIYLLVEAWHRFFSPEPISGPIMVTVAVIGLLANVIGTVLLKRGADKNLNLRAAYLHLLSDAVSSIGVIVGGLAITFWNVTWIDPLLTLGIAIYVLFEAFKILWHSLEVFMLAAPSSVSLEDVRNQIKKIEGVNDIHHIHLWQVSENDIHFEGHIVVPDQTLSKIDALRANIENLLHDNFEISHVTLQAETIGANCTTAKLA